MLEKTQNYSVNKLPSFITYQAKTKYVFSLKWLISNEEPRGRGLSPSKQFNSKTWADLKICSSLPPSSGRDCFLQMQLNCVCVCAAVVCKCQQGKHQNAGCIYELLWMHCSSSENQIFVFPHVAAPAGEILVWSLWEENVGCSGLGSFKSSETSW